jgi:hypothetical protein
MHWTPSVQVPPSGFFPQLPASQARPGTHWSDDVQSGRHRGTAAAVSHKKGAQLTMGPGAQIPLPSQTLLSTMVLAAHFPFPQAVPSGYLRHIPLPSQVPSVPHDVGPPSVHWARLRGLFPAGTKVHIPGLEG